MDALSETHVGAAEVLPSWEMQLQCCLCWRRMLPISSGHCGLLKDIYLLAFRDLETGQRQPQPWKSCPTAHLHNPMVPQTSR